MPVPQTLTFTARQVSHLLIALLSFSCHFNLTLCLQFWACPDICPHLCQATGNHWRSCSLAKCLVLMSATCLCCNLSALRKSFGSWILLHPGILFPPAFCTLLVILSFFFFSQWEGRYYPVELLQLSCIPQPLCVFLFSHPFFLTRGCVLDLV